MSPAIVRAVFGSCLALGAIDLAWLNLNASRMAVARASSAPAEDEPSGVAAMPAAVAPYPAVTGAPEPVAIAPPAAPPANHVDPPPRAPAPIQPSPPPASDLDPAVTNCVVQFDRSRSFLRPEESAHLAVIADAMRKHPRAVVRIEGHADRLAWRGNRGDNLTLSDDRASNVVRALVKLGVPPDRIRRAAFGDTKPLDDRASEEAYRRNRRVEVRVDPRGER